MKRNSRLSLAMHTLGHMACAPDVKQTSADIAQHSGTNPVVVRRVLGRLREAGLLTSEKGHAGGWLLARPPQAITLADVYLALGERLMFDPEEEEQLNCAVEHTLRHKVSALMEEMEDTFTKRLSAVTIADLATEHQH